MSFRLLLLLLFLLAAIGVFFMLDGGSSPPPAPAMANTVPAVGERQSPFPDPAPALSALEALAEEGRARVAVPSKPSGPPTTPIDLAIQVLRPDGEPAATATIWFYDPNDLEFRERWESWDAEQRRPGSSAMKDLFLSQRVDSDGVLRWAHDGAPAAFFAQEGEGRAFAVWQPRMGSEMTIRLRAPRSIAVLVQDFEGYPRGGVKIGWSWSIQPKFFRWREGIGNAISHPDGGLAVLGDLEFLPSSQVDPVAGAVLAEMVDVSSPRLPVPVAIWPAEPIPFRLPPFGEVRVVLDGVSADAKGRCTLSPPALQPGLLQPRGRVRRLLVNGEARFPCVALGLDLVAEVELVGRDGILRGAGPGPQVAGEQVVIRIDAVGGLVLSGRLLDREGSPVEEQNWSATLAGQWLRDQTELHTDSAGRFRLALDTDWLDHPPRSLFVETGIQRNRPMERVGAWIELLPILGPGETDLGDLVLDLPPLLASGAAVDRTGTPVPDTRFRLEVLDLPPKGETPGIWISAYLTRGATRSDQEGNFELRGWVGELAGSKFRLRASRSGFRQLEPLPFLLGQDDLRIVLVGCGSLVFSVLLPDGFDQGMLLHWRFLPASGEEPVLLMRKMVDGKEVNWDTALPGRYDLLSIPDFAFGALLTVPGIEIVAGQATRDPRLLPLDLRPYLGAAELTVRRGDGSLLLDPIQVTWIRPDGSRRVLEPGPTAPGRYLIPFVRTQPLDLLVECGDLQEVWLPAFSLDQDVVLRGRIEVDLHLLGEIGLRTSGEEIRLRFERFSLDGSRPVPGSRTSLEGDLLRTGEGRAVFPGAGLYRATWRVEARPEGLRQILAEYSGGEWRIDDSSHGTALELTPPEELRAARSGD